MILFCWWLKKCSILTIRSLCLGLISCPVLGQVTVPSPKAFEQKVQLQAVKMSLDDMLEVVTKQTQVSILVDDEPILENTSLTFDGSLHDTLDKVADSFDYTWRVSRAGVVLMSKRFKNPNERPQMNMPEMRDMAREIVRALTLVDYIRDEAQANEAVRRLFQSLTPAQHNALESGARVYGAELQPEQRATLQQAIFTRTFLPALKLWEDAIPRLENLQHSTLLARPRTPTPPTHDYFYRYRDADGKLHSFEIQHMVYGDNDGEVRTP